MKRIIALLIIIGLLITMWSVYGNYTEKDRIATVKTGEYTDVLDTQALIIRNEKTVEVSGTGYFQNNLASGSKVHEGENLGIFYGGTPDEDLVRRLNAVNERLHEVSASASLENLFVNDISSINERIDSYTKEISALAAKNDQKAINKIKDEINSLLERKANIEEGTNGKKDDIVITLTAEKNELIKKLGANTEDIYAPASGIFVTSTDSLEASLNTKDFEKFGVSDIKKFIKGEEKTKVYPEPICKVVDNSMWIAAFVCDTETANKFSKAGRVQITFAGSRAEKQSCRVVGVSKEEKGEKVIFLSCNLELYQLFTNRTSQVEVFVDNYKGLKVPAKALVSKQGKTYVDVVKAKKTTRKQVEVLYKDKNMAIVEEDNTKKGNLLLYEEVVLHDDE